MISSSSDEDESILILFLKWNIKLDHSKYHASNVGHGDFKIES